MSSNMQNYTLIRINYIHISSGEDTSSNQKYTHSYRCTENYKYILAYLLRPRSSRDRPHARQMAIFIASHPHKAFGIKGSDISDFHKNPG
jgi:hypothetical protein